MHGIVAGDGRGEENLKAASYFLLFHGEQSQVSKGNGKRGALLRAFRRHISSAECSGGSARSAGLAMARNPPLWGLGVSAGFHQSLGEEIPSAGASECDWSRLRYQKPRSCRGTGWDTLEPLTLHCLLLAGERDSGSCLSVHPSELQPWLIQTHLKGHFLHSPSSLPHSPQSRDSKGGSRVFDQRKRLFCCFGNTRNSLL